MKIEPDIGDINKSENKKISEEEEEEEIIEEKLIKVFTKVSARLKVDVPMYESNLNVKELID